MAKQSIIKLREITFSIRKKTRFFTSSEKTIGNTGIFLLLKEIEWIIFICIQKKKYSDITIFQSILKINSKGNRHILEKVLFYLRLIQNWKNIKYTIQYIKVSWYIYLKIIFKK